MVYAFYLIFRTLLHGNAKEINIDSNKTIFVIRIKG